MFLSNYGINRNISWINDLHDYTFFHKYFIMRRDKFWYGSALRQNHTKFHDGRNILSDSWEKNFQIHQEIVYSLINFDNSLLILRNNYSNFSTLFFIKIIKESLLKKIIFISLIFKLIYVFFFINLFIFIILFLHLNLLIVLILVFSIVLSFFFFPFFFFFLFIYFLKKNKIYTISLFLNFKKPFVFKLNIKNFFYLLFFYYFNFSSKFYFLSRNNLNYFFSCLGFFLNKYLNFFYQNSNNNNKLKFFIYLIMFFLIFLIFFNFFIFFDKYYYYCLSFFVFDYFKLFYLYNLSFFIFFYFLSLFFYKIIFFIFFILNIKILNKSFFYDFIFKLLLKLYFKNNYTIFIHFIYNLFPNNVLSKQLNINNIFEQFFILQNIKIQQHVKSFDLLKNFINK